MITNIEIVRVTPNHVKLLQSISQQTFTETFSAANTEENMRRYLDENLSMDKLSAEVNDKNAQFYFATIDDRIIGYLKLNFGSSQTEIKNDKAVEIERIYVIKEFHGQQVGKLLYQKALEIAKEVNANFLWLGVWEENKRAINFYKKNGFVEFDKHLFILGNDEQTDIMMKLELKG
jgi:diamine N-acetyltransferase